jgi:hypothetical protein
VAGGCGFLIIRSPGAADPSDPIAVEYGPRS